MSVGNLKRELIGTNYEAGERAKLMKDVGLIKTCEIKNVPYWCQDVNNDRRLEIR